MFGRGDVQWKPDCSEVFGASLIQMVSGKFQTKRLSVMQEATSHIPTLPLPLFPAGVDTRWETTNCVVWNDRERLVENQELIYEVAWIPELGIWRRFLRSRRKLPS
jgi:hypothetical protein